jgi:hypothetical protein
MKSIASIRLFDVLRPKNSGEPLNAHVIHVPPEPRPDYDAMNELLNGDRRNTKPFATIEDAEDAERGEVSTVR